jgi:hypothetical protein
MKPGPFGLFLDTILNAVSLDREVAPVILNISGVSPCYSNFSAELCLGARGFP